MGQFYVTVYVSNSRFAQIAIEAMLDRAPITMNGEFDEEARTVTGFVPDYKVGDPQVGRARTRLLAGSTVIGGL
jgi:hypothetical protein